MNNSSKSYPISESTLIRSSNAEWYSYLGSTSPTSGSRRESSSSLSALSSASSSYTMRMESAIINLMGEICTYIQTIKIHDYYNFIYLLVKYMK